MHAEPSAAAEPTSARCDAAPVTTARRDVGSPSLSHDPPLPVSLEQPRAPEALDCPPTPSSVTVLPPKKQRTDAVAGGGRAGPNISSIDYSTKRFQDALACAIRCAGEGKTQFMAVELRMARHYAEEAGIPMPDISDIEREGHKNGVLRRMLSDARRYAGMGGGGIR